MTPHFDDLLVTAMNRKNESGVSHLQNRRRRILPSLGRCKQKGRPDQNNRQSPQKLSRRQEDGPFSRRNPPMEQGSTGRAFTLRRKGYRNIGRRNDRKPEFHHCSGTAFPCEGFRFRTAFPFGRGGKPQIQSEKDSGTFS